MASAVSDLPVIRDPALAFATFHGAKSLAVDIETSGLSPFRDRVAVVSIADREGHVAVLHTRGDVPPSVRELLETTPLLIGHNAVTFDAAFLARAGVDVFRPAWYDTMMGEQITIAVNRKTVSKSLDASLRRHLGRRQGKGSLTEHRWMDESLNPEQVEYCARDVVNLHRLMDAQLEKADEGQRQEIALGQQIFGPVVRMQFNGLPIDRPLFNYAREKALQDREKARAKLPSVFHSVNMRSPLQVKQALHSEGLMVVSTGTPVLQSCILDGDHPDLCRALIQFREADQILKMYSEEWDQKYIIWHGDQGLHRAHARYNPYGTDTGRFSCSEPNLQQVPKDGRWMFTVTDPELWIVSVDYSQIEIRLAAAYAKDRALLEAIKDTDVHSAIARQIFGIPEGAQVPKKSRQMAKAASFALLYGGGPALLHDQIRRRKRDEDPEMSMEEVQVLFDRFFDTYQGLAGMRNRAYSMARAGRVVELSMPSGLRRVMVPGQTLDPQTILNTVVQGAAASGLKYALVEAKKHGLDREFAGCVHDEIVAVVRGPESRAQEYAGELSECMVQGMRRFTQIPIRADAHVDHTWATVEDLEWDLQDRINRRVTNK